MRKFPVKLKEGFKGNKNTVAFERGAGRRKNRVLQVYITSPKIRSPSIGL